MYCYHISRALYVDHLLHAYIYNIIGIAINFDLSWSHYLSSSGGADYIPIMTIIHLTGINISPGSRHSFTIPVIDDNNLEPDETLFLLLNSSSPGVLVNSSTAMAVVIIVDDDGQCYHSNVFFFPTAFTLLDNHSLVPRLPDLFNVCHAHKHRNNHNEAIYLY